MKLTYKFENYEIFHQIEFHPGTLLSTVLRKVEPGIDMPCGGMGRCGKCKVRFIEGACGATDTDRRFFSDEMLKDGWRLACRAVLSKDARIVIPDCGYENKGGGRDRDLENQSVIEAERGEKITVSGGKLGIAIDIGTTTIGGALADLETGKVLKKTTRMNHQRVYGADVISRIKAANEGHAGELKSLALTDIGEIIRELKGLIKKSDCENIPENNHENNKIDVRNVVIAGNTTMLHILMGDSLSGLGVAPYKPARLRYPRGMECGIPGSDDANINYEIVSGISAFVGADIVSGMFALDFHEIPYGKKYMLIDLGTNGEMAIGDSERILVCSTAAGPVFEGGGITLGMAGVPGAIEHVDIDDRKTIRVKTIGDVLPQGICGSGVLEAVSELRRNGIIDETGLFEDEFFDEGYPLYGERKNDIRITQTDIRNVQMAKAAIRSGIDSLLKSFGCRADEVDRVYLAGGFSEHLDADKVKYLKLLPEEFLRSKVVESAGNAALSGCLRALLDSEHDSKIDRIISLSREIVLAAEDSFKEGFIDKMNF